MKNPKVINDILKAKQDYEIEFFAEKGIFQDECIIVSAKELIYDFVELEANYIIHQEDDGLQYLKDILITPPLGYGKYKIQDFFVRMFSYSFVQDYIKKQYDGEIPETMQIQDKEGYGITDAFEIYK